MWIPKVLRDRRKGVDSPMPTQLVSNEELIPRRQGEEQHHVDSKGSSRSAQRRRLAHAYPTGFERGVDSPPPDRRSEESRIPDRRNGGTEIEEAGHGTAQI